MALERILITVKTYPLPSASYLELVCTAGVREDGRLIRLYPIDYRYEEYWEWYRKYQWIELEIEKNPKDPRPESFRPIPGTKIHPFGPPLDTKNGWQKRKEVVFRRPILTMCAHQKIPQQECSLGIVKARSVSGFSVDPGEVEWKPAWQDLFRQQQLFGPQRKPLNKIPFQFRYVFHCLDRDCRGHQMLIEDWEVGQLFLKMKEKFGGNEIAAQKVKERFLGEICGPDKDTYFWVGTTLEFGTFVILGVFWPPKTDTAKVTV